MKRIGLIGGMSWESSLLYYKLINEEVRAKLGGFNSADCIMHSVNFADIEAMQKSGRWDDAADLLAQSARHLYQGGAGCVVLCTNTMHKVADAIQNAVPIPFLHIADATANAIRASGYTHVGLLGTRFTMDEPFYSGRLTDKYGLTVLLPDADGRQMVNRVIFDELVHGVIRDESREAYIRQIESLAGQGAQAVILGCTEIGMLIHPEHSPIPTFDTTVLHANVAVAFALGD
ncbi:MAG: aspartate/glutamate racemase family protein [Anaerolineae bacterium]|nr:aspartate/glutamate racemase family protein [Anaerolineae bacterium]